MANNLPWFHFYAADWRTDPKLNRCSHATKGIWIDLLCAMHLDGRSGIVTGDMPQLARLVGSTEREITLAIAELARTQTADVTYVGDEVTVTNRRMKRESNEREATRVRVEKHRSNGDVTANQDQCNPLESLVMSQESGVSSQEADSKAKKQGNTSAPRKAQALSADDLVAYFSQQPVYATVNVATEVALCIDWWQRNKGRTPSQRAVGNWLGKSVRDAPLLVQNGHAPPKRKTVGLNPAHMTQEERLKAGLR